MGFHYILNTPRNTNDMFTHEMWTSTPENPTLLPANNKGTDQPAHPRRLVTAFVIRPLDRKIIKLSTCKISTW